MIERKDVKLNLLQKAQEMLKKHPLCDHCLGRQFALLGFGINNEARGEALKLLLTMKAHDLTRSGDKNGLKLLRIMSSNGKFLMAAEILKRLNQKSGERQSCYICNECFDSMQEVVNLVVNKLEEYEYSSLLVGIEIPIEVEEREDEFKSTFTVNHGESLRKEFSRNLGKKIAMETGKTTEYHRPDIVILINPFTKQVSLQINPLHIGGRYRKLIRGIPQSRWFCSRCRGKGCPECHWTGKLYSESVEEIVGNPTLEVTEGEDIAFHGAGREDIDARMLGRGRPFVVEIKRPKKRFVNLKKLQKLINDRSAGKVEVSNLHPANKEAVRILKKNEAAKKLYKVIVDLEKEVSKKQLNTLQKALTGTIIRQQTPLRVVHRRADLMREKYIYKTKVKKLTQNRIEMRIRCEGGLYIKELVNGDEGRTIPNVAGILDTRAVPLELDVIGVFVEEKA